MESIDRIFNNLDKWRHFPCYQLERRADIFFSLYLQEVLEKRFDVPLHPVMIPEFPLSKRLILTYASGADRKCFDEEESEEDEDQSSGIQHLSYKVDYLVIAQDFRQAFLVELKTDPGSRNLKQDTRMMLAEKAGLVNLLDALKDIFLAQKIRKNRFKYYHMVRNLKEIGLVDYSSKVDEIMLRDNHKGIYDVFESYSSVDLQCNTEAVYLEPVAVDQSGIGFDEILETVDKYDDPLSRRFGESLRQWMKPAGSLEN